MTTAGLRRAAPGDALGYEALRARALELVQEHSGELWTDYNQHDPGVTLMEALVFALSEGLYGADQTVADLLTAADGRIHYRRHGLQAGRDILPCRPTTPADYAAWLRARVPGLGRLHLEAAPTGLWRLAVQAAAGEGEQVRMATARAWWSRRNLGEDLDALPTLLAPRWCELEADIEVAGARELADILAELIILAADHIATRDKVDATEPDDEAAPAPDSGDRLYFSDLIRILEGIDGIVEIRRLRLSALGLDAGGGTLPWLGPDWALRLRLPEHPRDLAGLHVWRRGSRLDLPAADILRRLADRGTRPAHPGGRRPPDQPANGGRHQATAPYYSAYNHLPPVYHDTAMAATDRAQFTTWLALAEHWLAHGEAQTGHLRELYSVDGAPRHSYWWQLPDPDQLPGLAEHAVDPPERIRQLAFAARDPVLERRGRILDHLLALHGEGCGQSSLRPFGHYFSAATWEQHLFRQKRRFLLRIVRHTRDRNAAFDYSRRSFGRPGNTCVLQERVSLLLAFRHHHSRSLLQGLQRFGVELAQDSSHDPRSPLPDNARPLHLEAEEDDGGSLAELFPQLAAHPLATALLRLAVHSDRYRVADADLWLGPDGDGLAWPLAHRGGAEAAARRLLGFARQLQLECEGMHLVEHLLLRPVADPAVAPPAARITAVFPAWTARCADPVFRRLAEETLALSSPAHLLPDVLWLEPADLARFEADYTAWLAAKQAHCHAPVDDLPTAAELDRRSATLRATLAQFAADRERQP